MQNIFCAMCSNYIYLISCHAKFCSGSPHSFAKQLNNIKMKIIIRYVQAFSNGWNNKQKKKTLAYPLQKSHNQLLDMILCYKQFIFLRLPFRMLNVRCQDVTYVHNTLYYLCHSETGSSE